MKEVRGIVPVVLTPLLEDKRLDVLGLSKIVEFLHTFEHIGGLWVLGTGSEDMHLSMDKRLHAAFTACNANDGRLPLILGCGFFSMDDIRSFMYATRGLDFDAYHIMPYNPKMSLNNLYAFYEKAAEYSEKPIWLYASGNWSIKLPACFIEGLKEHPSGKFVGIKFSSTNTKELFDVLALADDKFQVITAVASQLYTCLCLGSKGHTSSLACCLPEPMIDIWKSYNCIGSYNSHAALGKQRKLNTFLDEMAKLTKKDNFLSAADEKYILKLREVCDVYMTDGYRQIYQWERVYLRALLKEYKYMENIGG
jgi:4-hydroxy-tetrahydrodipicolinate synthase